jgi:hypothetical protein
MSGHLSPEEHHRVQIDSPLTTWLPRPASIEELASAVASALAPKQETGELAKKT